MAESESTQPVASQSLVFVTTRWADTCFDPELGTSSGIQDADLTQHYGNHVIMNAAPKVDNMAEYKIGLNSVSTYEIYIEYKSMENRPCEVSIRHKDDKEQTIVNEQAMQNAAGTDWHFEFVPDGCYPHTWKPDVPKWYSVGTVAVKKTGTHYLRIFRAKAPFPHIRAIGVCRK